jgi:zinc transporter ZupT
MSEGLAASLAAACVSTTGLLSMAALGDWGKRHGSYFSAFAIGVLLVAVVFHIAPEAYEYDVHFWRYMLAGLFTMAGFGLALWLLSHNGRTRPLIALGYVSIIALGFHSFVDGLIYIATFQGELFTGTLATGALLLHEFPEGVIAYFLARDAGLRPLSSVACAFVAASATTVVGALAASQYVVHMSAMPLGPLLGLAAGGLLYIVFFHLMPHATTTPKKRGYIMASLGVIVGMVSVIAHTFVH